MTSWNMKTYHLKGLEIMNGTLSLNDNPLKIGDWSFEIGADGDLLFKKDCTIQAKITCHSNLPKKINNDRFFIIDPLNINECIGMLVSNTNTYYNFDFTQSPTIDQSIPTIQLCKKQQDPTIVGVISGCENFSREYDHGVFKTVYRQEDGVNRVIVSTNGLSSMWVTDINGSFNNGDFITSSNIPGYGMKQMPPNIQYNFTWARIMQDCDFSPEIKVLRQPVDFNRDGPIYQPLTNNDGDFITAYEYQIKYVDIKGNETTRIAFEKDLKLITDEEYEKLDISGQCRAYEESSTNSHESSVDMEEVLKNPNRKVFRVCLVGYQR